jgi:hypothetical protein
VSEGGKSKRVSTQKALLLRIREKALKGESRALEKFLKLASVHNATDGATNSGSQQMGADPPMDLEHFPLNLTHIHHA